MLSAMRAKANQVTQTTAPIPIRTHPVSLLTQLDQRKGRVKSRIKAIPAPIITHLAHEKVSLKRLLHEVGFPESV